MSQSPAVTPTRDVTYSMAPGTWWRHKTVPETYYLLIGLANADADVLYQTERGEFRTTGVKRWQDRMMPEPSFSPAGLPMIDQTVVDAYTHTPSFISGYSSAVDAVRTISRGAGLTGVQIALPGGRLHIY